MIFKKIKLIVIVFIFSAICLQTTILNAQLTQGFQNLKVKWAPDNRIAIFDINYSFEDDKWHISAETNIPEAGIELEEFIKKSLTEDSYTFKLDLLPSKSLGDSTYAIVCISVANIRRETRFSAELIDQAILGTELTLLKKRGGRYLVQTPYGYIGWMLKGSICLVDSQSLNKWRSEKKVKIISNYAQIFSEPNLNSLTMSDAVFGATLKYIKTMGEWIQVEFPDRTTGYIEKKYSEDFFTNSDKKVNPDDLITTAKKLLGIPYLWGGNSSKGLDCSGFTQTVFKNHGIFLPRDANMQVNLGHEIQITEDFNNIKPGDLLFFGAGYKSSAIIDTDNKIIPKLENRITHVAISLGGPLFIHSSGKVHINSLKIGDEYFNAYRKDTLRHVKRIIKD